MLALTKDLRTRDFSQHDFACVLPRTSQRVDQWDCNFVYMYLSHVSIAQERIEELWVDLDDILSIYLEFTLGQHSGFTVHSSSPNMEIVFVLRANDFIKLVCTQRSQIYQ